jgi:hypothetical protein
MLRGEAANTNLMLFDLTQPRLEARINHTQGEYVNHYNTHCIINHKLDVSMLIASI